MQFVFVVSVQSTCFVSDIYFQGYEDSRLLKDLILFDHNNTPQLREYISYIPDEENKNIAVEFLDKWDSLADTLSALPKGIIQC